MTTSPLTELAHKDPANLPAPVARKVINAHAVTRRWSGWTVTGVFALLLAAFLLTGLLISLIQQNA